MSLPVVTLTILGIVVAVLGLFAAGNVWVVALGLGSVAFAGILDVLGRRQAS